MQPGGFVLPQNHFQKEENGHSGPGCQDLQWQQARAAKHQAERTAVGVLRRGSDTQDKTGRAPADAKDTKLMECLPFH